MVYLPHYNLILYQYKKADVGVEGMEKTLLPLIKIKLTQNLCITS